LDVIATIEEELASAKGLLFVANEHGNDWRMPAQHDQVEGLESADHALNVVVPTAPARCNMHPM